MDGLYIDQSTMRYFFAAVVLIVLAVSSLSKGGKSTLFRAHAFTWLLLAASQLAWVIPVTISQTPTALFAAGVAGFGLYWMASIGAAVAFSAIFLEGKQLFRRFVIGGSIVFSLAAFITSWIDHVEYPPLFIGDPPMIEKEHLFAFRVFFALTLILFLPVGMHIFQQARQHLSGPRKLVGMVDGIATMGAALSGFVFLSGDETAVVPIFILLSLLGFVIIVASWLRSRQANSNTDESNAQS